MAHAELGHAGTKRVMLAATRETDAPRTQYMLAVTSAASVIILVVAALFMSLF